MQLLSIAIYNGDGKVREVPFIPGKLNIVSGLSRTGKSVLLTIVDYCLGRDDARLPAGKHFAPITWCGTLWELEGGARAFLGRPTIASNASSNSRAMIEFGGQDLGVPPYSALVVNTSSDSLRQQVGLRIGIEDSKIQPNEYSSRKPFSVGLGSAALLCFQAQFEIGNQALLFHRQGERGKEQVLQDTLPYYLGAIVSDEAAKRAALREARIRLRRIESTISAAENEARSMDITLQRLIVEAHGAGMVPVAQAPDTNAAIEILSRIRYQKPEPLSADVDTRAQDNGRELYARLSELRSAIRSMLADRDLLLDNQDGQSGYEKALNLQRGRMVSLELLGEHKNHASHLCPVCNHTLEQDDPTPDQLQNRLRILREELVDLNRAVPDRRKAVAELDVILHEKRRELQGVEDGLNQLLQNSNSNLTSNAESREFVRGRIDATLSRTSATDDIEIDLLRQQREEVAGLIAALENDLDADSAREQLTSRLVAVGRDMTSFARRLKLEHSNVDVRLDVAKLTVVADSETGPAPLTGIGSAENWIGYHLVTHLALHRYFTRQNRPVPRLLMLDQPTQAYFQSEAALESGTPDDADREAVSNMFRLMKDVADELAPKMQIIVVDHAKLTDDWFADSIVHDWRDGIALVPSDWGE